MRDRIVRVHPLEKAGEEKETEQFGKHVPHHQGRKKYLYHTHKNAAQLELFQNEQINSSGVKRVKVQVTTRIELWWMVF